jgi:Arc/MetJ-type ribon-helix-helix transcriptional regulator
MGILEKLRPTPRWKHTDPSVRAAAVYDLGPEDGEALRALAREDADTRVRRAAVTRLDEADVLADVARTDPDEEVRGEAVRGLAGLAAEADDVSAATDAVRHLLALGRVKEVVVVARASTSAAVRDAIVDLLEDQKALGSLSRHAADNSTRLRALARVTDVEELLNVALKSEHTDVAVAALERIDAAEPLGAISQRARNKVAARRARTKLRVLEEPPQAPQGDAVSMSATDQQRAKELLQRAEALVAIADPGEAAAKLSQARLAWAEFQADVVVDGALAQQFESASDAVREAIAERQQERAAERERAEAIAREQADRVAICHEIEGLGPEPAAMDRIAELKVRWDGLPPMPSEYAASLTRRFQDACRAFEARERRRMLAQAAVGRLETLATELEQLIASTQPLEEIVARWRGLRRDADVLREHISANPDAGARLEQAVATLEQKEQEHQQHRTKVEQDNLKRLQQVARQVETLAAAEQMSLKAGDRALRDIKTAIEDRAPLPSKKDRQELQARLEAARATLGPRVQELRDADEWQRWANLQVEEELCKEMEALKAEENLETASRRMRELQARWKQVALAPRAQGEAMWRRFKAAQDEVFARTSAHLAAQNEERAANLVAKLALCERAEALADSTDWVKTAAEIQGLQADWKKIGPVSRGHEKAVWERFRAACDRFFTRRQEDLKHRKEEWASNLAKKEALCEKAEAVADSTEWESAASQLKRLQAEWKTVGPVRKSKSEAVWQRFRGACDRFFDRYKHRDQVELQQKAAARDQIIRDLEALLPQNGSIGDAPENLYASVHDARTKWQHAPEVPRQVQQDLAARYHQAIGQLIGTWPGAFAGTDLDPETTRKRMEKLLSKVEELLPVAQERVQKRQLTPTELLAEKWRERLAANTIAGSRAAEENEEVRWRNAEQEVRSAQSQWTRLGPVPAEVAGPLNERFQRAVRRFYDSRRKVS